MERCTRCDQLFAACTCSDPAPRADWMNYWHYANRWAEHCMRVARMFGFL
jgi:hypothetical protein